MAAPPDPARSKSGSFRPVGTKLRLGEFAHRALARTGAAQHKHHIGRRTWLPRIAVVDHNRWRRCHALLVDVPLLVGRRHGGFTGDVVGQVAVQPGDPPRAVGAGPGERRVALALAVRAIPRQLALPVSGRGDRSGFGLGRWRRRGHKQPVDFRKACAGHLDEERVRRAVSWVGHGLVFWRRQRRPGIPFWIVE